MRILAQGYIVEIIIMFFKLENRCSLTTISTRSTPKFVKVVLNLVNIHLLKFHVSN